MWKEEGDRIADLNFVMAMRWKKNKNAWDLQITTIAVVTRFEFKKKKKKKTRVFVSKTERKLKTDVFLSWKEPFHMESQL